MDNKNLLQTLSFEKVQVDLSAYNLAQITTISDPKEKRCLHNSTPNYTAVNLKEPNFDLCSRAFIKRTTFVRILRRESRGTSKKLLVRNNLKL